MAAPFVGTEIGRLAGPVSAIVEFSSLEDAGLWEQFLSDDERQAAAQRKSEEVKARFVIGRGLRRKMLAEASGTDVRDLCFADSDLGKPRVTNAGGWDFNVSHSGDLVAVAVARGAVGVDVEMIRPVREMESIVARYFHPDEAAAWRAVDESLREEAFFVLWSAREAAMKCAGLGLAKGMSVTRVDPSILRGCEVSARVGKEEVSVRRIDVPRGYIGIVALAGSR